MSTRWFGEPVKRNEDERFLTGSGTYVDDVMPAGAVHAAVLRSPVAHARITRIDCSAARSLPGVLEVWTWEDLGDLWRPSPMVVPHDALTHPRTQYPLARDKVNYVGEAVALVVALDRYIAEDACDLIEIEYESMPAVTELEESAFRSDARARGCSKQYGRPIRATNGRSRSGICRGGSHFHEQLYLRAFLRSANGDPSHRRAMGRAGNRSPCGTRPRRRCPSAMVLPYSWACQRTRSE